MKSLVLFLTLASAMAADLSTRIADRAAVERIYYQHRLGNKPSFEQALPREILERLVRDDLRKETALGKAYGVAVTPAMLEAEVQRIQATTRAPDILAELEAALGNDPNRFARTVAQPIIVERLLRERFDNDDKLHAAPRREAERVRAQLIAAAVSGNEAPSENSAIRNPEPETKATLSQDPPQRRVRARSPQVSAPNGTLVGPLPSAGGVLHGPQPKSETTVSHRVAILKRAASGQVTEITWRLGPRPAEKPGAETPEEVENRQRLGPNAPLLSPPHAGGKDRKFYFTDLPAALQRVLQAQLRQAGDVSAVIEMPGAFLVYVCTEKTGETLSVATLSWPKRSYEQWLAAQDETTNGS